MITVFADTYYYLALLNAADEDHARAVAWTAGFDGRIVTTDAVLDLCENRPDKDWSLTDCISFVVMEGQQIEQALTADHHFRQAGFTVLLA